MNSHPWISFRTRCCSWLPSARQWHLSTLLVKGSPCHIPLMRFRYSSPPHVTRSYYNYGLEHRSSCAQHPHHPGAGASFNSGGLYPRPDTVPAPPHSREVQIFAAFFKCREIDSPPPDPGFSSRTETLWCYFLEIHCLFLLYISLHFYSPCIFPPVSFKIAVPIRFVGEYLEKRAVKFFHQDIPGNAVRFLDGIITVLRRHRNTFRLRYNLPPSGVCLACYSRSFN